MSEFIRSIEQEPTPEVSAQDLCLKRLILMAEARIEGQTTEIGDDVIVRRLGTSITEQNPNTGAYRLQCQEAGCVSTCLMNPDVDEASKIVTLGVLTRPQECIQEKI